MREREREREKKKKTERGINGHGMEEEVGGIGECKEGKEGGRRRKKKRKRKRREGKAVTSRLEDVTLSMGRSCVDLSDSCPKIEPNVEEGKRGREKGMRKSV